MVVGAGGAVVTGGAEVPERDDEVLVDAVAGAGEGGDVVGGAGVDAPPHFLGHSHHNVQVERDIGRIGHLNTHSRQR